jgi:hypothetical protein
MGFEPMTFSLEGTKTLDPNLYKAFLNQKYSKQYASMQFSYALKYPDCLENPSKLLSIPEGNRANVLKAMVCLAKFLGCYEPFKAKLKNYGIHWVNADTAFNGFLSIFGKEHDSLAPWIKQIQPLLHENEKLFLRFLAVTGLRKNEAITSLNMIIELSSMGNLCDYYNEELSVLEHFKYGKLFLRGTKNAYISFVSREMISEICSSQRVNYSAIMSRLRRKEIKLRFKELRSYHNSYLRKNGLISELVDVLAGRVPKTVFARHYLGEDMKTFSKQVLEMENDLEKSLLS